MRLRRGLQSRALVCARQLRDRGSASKQQRRLAAIIRQGVREQSARRHPDRRTRLALTDVKRAFLRHTLATVAYRAAKVERDAPPGFGTFQLGKNARTPVELVAHLGDLFDWALSMVSGKSEWAQS